MEVKKDVYSVWALPSEELKPRLKRPMEGLRSEFGGPQFEPHMIVVGAVRLTKSTRSIHQGLWETRGIRCPRGDSCHRNSSTSAFFFCFIQHLSASADLGALQQLLVDQRNIPHEEGFFEAE